MRHEDHGRPGLRPDSEQLHVEALARHLVECAERLVHEQELRRERQRPRNRDPLLHPARQLPRVVLLEAGELDEVDHLADTRGTPRAVPAEHLERQRDVLRHRPPVVEHRRLEDDAVVAVETRTPRRLPVHGHIARRRLDDVSDDPQQRGLSAAGWPDQRDELAAIDLEVDPLECGDSAALAEDLREALDRDDRSARTHTSRSGARCTTTFSAKSTTRKKATPSAAA